MTEEHHHHELSGKNLLIAVVLNGLITLAQIIGGVLSGSLSLLSDALHNFSDVLALSLAWGANKIASKAKSENKSFGYKRAEILATLFNAASLVGIGVYLIVEAAHRFFNPEPINALIVIYLALFGIVLNVAAALLIKEDSHDNMNMKAAYLHLISDVGTSIAVLIGGLAITYWNSVWIDPALTVIIAFYLIISAWGLVKESIGILMQFGPKHINQAAINRHIAPYEAILNIHHVHVWQLDEHDTHLEAHLDFKENLPLEEVTQIISSIEEDLKKAFHLAHVTLQAEYNRGDCKSFTCGVSDH